MTSTYVIEVEVSTHDALKAGTLAVPRGLTSSRYPSCGAPDTDTADRSSYSPPVLLGGPRYTTIVLSADEVADDTEARLLAAQIACVTSGAMPTRTDLISYPVEGL